jgi:hypothetical protein
MLRLSRLCLLICGLAVAMTAPARAADVERWGLFETALSAAPAANENPFTDVTFTATFQHGATRLEVPGFYDGDATYRLRFSPPEEGDWQYTTHSNRPALDGKTGSLTCTRPAAGNHGPVGVHNTFHFAYADGSPYTPIGTTCYYTLFQPDALQDQTLATLKASPFNKVRMFVMPNADAYPPGAAVYPFEGTPPKSWDFTRFNPAFFQAIDKRLAGFRDSGIQADLILFNVYDKGRWGYDNMGAANDDRYLRYLVARYAAYRNVWWSLANEFDLGKTKTDADWDRFFQVLESTDPYARLRSIHHSMRLYDYSKPWVTHASLQNGSAVEDFGRAELYRDVWNKPVVLDEVKYEGNIELRWGQLSGEEMTERFWQGTIAGVYVGHGECFQNSGDVWLSKGGTLKGTSPPRIAFLRSILDAGPPDGIDPIDKWQDVHTAGKAGSYYLIYFGREKPTSWRFELPKAGLKEGMTFKVDVLDTWQMTTTPVDATFTIRADGRYRYHADGPEIPLPGRPYMALRITSADKK